MKIGDFETKILLLSITRTKDASGGNVETIQQVSTIFGHVEPNQDTKVTPIAVLSANNLVVQIHLNRQISPSHILLIDGFTYDVSGIRTVDRIYMQLNADRSDKNIQQYINLEGQLVNLEGEVIVL